MATKLFLRNTTTNGVTGTGDTIVYDMLVTAGSASDTDTTDTVASGTQIQWTQNTTADETIAWVSGRVPAGGFTLTTTTFSVWIKESAIGVNAGGRFRLFNYTAAGAVVELGGGPFEGSTEFPTVLSEGAVTGNVTDTAFQEDDRVLVRFYVINIGTMGVGTVDVAFNAADATTGDSFLELAQDVTFKPETVLSQRFRSSRRGRY